MSKQRKPKPETPAERKAILLWPFIDFAEQGEDQLAAYLRHVGINDVMVKYAGNVEKAVCAHYRIGDSDHYDYEKAGKDLASWPPIARRLAEVRAERKE
ncbi:MAG TPA: hypothetical protein VGX03_21810 [Candidatus Binatia bacterium]|jgi:hypothetical protein|nr:hypothetical protein [Candidatus Binatia bacterium]